MASNVTVYYRRGRGQNIAKVSNGHCFLHVYARRPADQRHTKSAENNIRTSFFQYSAGSSKWIQVDPGGSRHRWRWNTTRWNTVDQAPFQAIICTRLAPECNLCQQKTCRILKLHQEYYTREYLSAFPVMPNSCLRRLVEDSNIIRIITQESTP